MMVPNNHHPSLALLEERPQVKAPIVTSLWAILHIHTTPILLFPKVRTLKLAYLAYPLKRPKFCHIFFISVPGITLIMFVFLKG